MSEPRACAEAKDLRAAIQGKRTELASLEARLAVLEAGSDIVQLPAQDQTEPVDPLPDSTDQEALPGHKLRTVAYEHFTQSEYQRYGRQLILPEIGPSGQANLRNARVLIVGTGGLGCPAAAYLAGAGIGTIGLIDGDTVDASNLHRQILHSTLRVGMSKVDSALQYLQGLNPLVMYHVYNEHLQPERAVDIFQQYDLILDCTDHPTSRYLISDTCVLTGKPLVSASALKTDGQLIVLNDPPLPPGEIAGGPCYRCIFPRPPPAESLISCGEGGILGPVVGVMGVLQALEAIKLLTNDRLDEPAKPKLLIFAGYGEPQFRSVRMRSRRAGCAACSSKGTITKASLAKGNIDYVAFCGLVSPIQILPALQRVSAKTFNQALDQAGNTVIDTRDSTQYAIGSLQGSINIPWTGSSDIWLKKAIEHEQVQSAQNLYVICRLGNDSQHAANALIKQGGYENVYDVEGGFRAWRQEIDPSWPDY